MDVETLKAVALNAIPQGVSADFRVHGDTAGVFYREAKLGRLMALPFTLPCVMTRSEVEAAVADANAIYEAGPQG